MHSERKETWREITCKRSFNAYLRKKLNVEDICWLAGDEPPDYYLVVKGVKYAVEATTIMEMIPLGQTVFPKAYIYFSHIGILPDVEEQALKEDLLKGTYAVIFSKPITNLKQYRDVIKERLTNYVRRTRDDSFNDAEVIFKRQDEKVTILKQHNRSAMIGIGGIARSKWGANARQEVLFLIQDRIKTKVEKLSMIKLPKILLLFNDHNFINITDYRDFVPKLKDIKSFHTVFMVENEQNGYILYSKNHDGMNGNNEKTHF